MKKLKISFDLTIILLFILSLYSGSIIIFLGVLLSILLHELSHLFFLLIFGGKVSSIKFSLFGGMLNVYKRPNSFIKREIINISGVIINILLFHSFSLLKMNILSNYNLCMVIFNLIPIYPLDGYRIIEDVLDLIYEDEFKNHIMSLSSFLINIIFIVITVFIKEYGMLIILCYLFINNVYKSLQDKQNIKLIQYSKLYKVFAIKDKV